MKPRSLRLSLVFAGAAALATLGPGTAPGAARARAVQPFELAELFLELNDTDGDLGIHGEIDQDAWTSLAGTPRQ